MDHIQFTVYRKMGAGRYFEESQSCSDEVEVTITVQPRKGFVGGHPDDDDLLKVYEEIRVLLDVKNKGVIND